MYEVYVALQMCINMYESNIYVHITTHILQWNLSNQDTIVTDYSEVSSFQRLLSTQMWHLGQMKVSGLYMEVSL